MTTNLVILTVLCSLMLPAGRILGGAAAIQLACGLCALLSIRQVVTDSSGVLQRRWFTLLVAAVPAVAGLQFGAAVLFSSEREIPLLVQPQSAVFVIAVTLFLCASVAVTTKPICRQRLVGVLATIGVVEATYGVLNLLAGNERLLLWRRISHADSATGTFVNRNDFACLLELTIPLAVLVAAQRIRSAAPELRPRQRVAEERSKRVVAALCISMMGLGLVLSRSRMGVVSLGLATMLVLSLDRILRPNTEPPPGEVAKSTARTVVLTIGLVFFLLVGVGIDLAVERFASAGSDLARGRLPIWTEAAKLFLANPILGSGYGSFELVLPAIRQEPTGFVYTHAHSEYLELLAETGMVGATILTAILMGFVRRVFASLRARLDPWRRRHIMATSIAILSILFHATVDYAFHVPAIALTLAIVIALFLQASVPPPPLWRSRTRP